MEEKGQKKDNKYPWTAKRIAALTGIVLLVLLYVVTLIAAIFDSPQTGRLFRACLGLTVFIPLFLWVVIWCIGMFRNKKTIASMDILRSDPEERQKMEEEIRQMQEQEP